MLKVRKYLISVDRFCLYMNRFGMGYYMEKICDSVIKLDHLPKTSGSAVYVADFPTEGMLFGKLLHSKKPHARIIDVKIPPLPDGYLIVDKNDVPGVNRVHIVEDDTPVFAEETVEYIGDPILMAVGPDEKEVLRIINAIDVVYEDLPAIISLRDADTVFFNYEINKGDIEKAFAEADKVFEEQFETGLQEHCYLETQGVIAEAHDGRMTVHGSMQCPYYINRAVAKVLGCGPSDVQIIQDETGGAFGGKEDYPSIVACQAAVAARKAGKPVRLIFDRREDMEFTSKRHPSLCTYRAAVKDGRITAMDIDVIYDAGAYTTLTPVVLQRGIICADGVYSIANLHVRGRAVKTNTVPNGAFRGFGGPQTFFAIEMMMDHIANNLGEDSLEFKEKHLAQQGDATSTSGEYHFPVPIPAMIEEVDNACGFRRKRAEYAKPQTGRYRRGIGMSLFFHGAGFTGSGERDFIKAVAKLHKRSDGIVEILAASTDMGQGLKTTLTKIVANELRLPLDRVVFDNADTDRMPDSGPTVASRSVMIVGELLRRAAASLREQWKDGEDLTITENYRSPDYIIPFDIATFRGDAYPTYSWAVNAIEVEVDTLTGLTSILGSYGSFDVGTPIDINIITGQMEGGVLQGIGYASMEQIAADAKGRIRNNNFSDYIIPTAMDAPNIKTMIHVEKYPDGPYGAKGAGELPIVGIPASYTEAMEMALGTRINHIPFTAEDTMKALQEVTAK